MFNQQPFFNTSGHRTHSNQTKMKLHCVQRLVIKKLLVVKSPYGWLGHGKEVDPLPPFPCLCPIKTFLFKIQSVKIPLRVYFLFLLCISSTYTYFVLSICQFQIERGEGGPPLFHAPTSHMVIRPF